MDKTEFWEIIETVRAAAAGKELQSESVILSDELSKRSLEEIADWHLIMSEYMDAANLPELAAEKQLLGYFSGAGDADNTMFRAWIISCGKETFLRALHDPMSLADAPAPKRYGNYVQYAYAAYPAYITRQFFDGRYDENEDLGSAVWKRRLGEAVLDDLRKDFPPRSTDPAGLFEGLQLGMSNPC